MVLGLLIALGIFAELPPVGAEFIRVNVYIDKVTYTSADASVNVTGCLSSDSPSVLGRKVSIQVYGPDGKIVLSDAAVVDSTCNFSASIDTRSLPKYGDYLIVVTHESGSDKKAFRFSEDTNDKEYGECANYSCTYHFELFGNIYQVQYKLSSGKLDAIIVDFPARALMFLVNSTLSNGTLTATIPKSVIDSQENGTDVRYKVFIGSLTEGAKYVEHEERGSVDNARVLVVDYPTSNENVLISFNGTYLVPELGPEILLIVSAIAGLITLSARFLRPQV